MKLLTVEECHGQIKHACPSISSMSPSAYSFHRLSTFVLRGGMKSSMRHSCDVSTSQARGSQFCWHSMAISTAKRDFICTSAARLVAYTNPYSGQLCMINTCRRGPAPQAKTEQETWVTTQPPVASAENFFGSRTRRFLPRALQHGSKCCLGSEGDLHD